MYYSKRGAPTKQRLLDRMTIDPVNGCWNWRGGLVSGGYGGLCVVGAYRKAHRLAYEAFVGPIPEGFTIDHLCRNRGCINPEHLEPVTPRVNILRGVGLAAKEAQQTHCFRGHEFDLLNTGHPKNHKRSRYCKTCDRERSRLRPDRVNRTHRIATASWYSRERP